MNHSVKYPEPLVVLDSVTAGYRDEPVFEQLSLQISEGDFAGIVGPSGAGKSTLLKTITGSIRIHSGSVKIAGRPVNRNRSGTIGYVPQLDTSDCSFPATVEQVILMGINCRLGITPWPSRRERRQADELATRLGISGCMHHAIGDVSGGQKQRALLARALISRPRLLILDEPTVGVDMHTQQEIMQLLHSFNNEGMTIVMTTHDLNEVAASLPRVICFNHKVIAQGTPETVYTAKILKETFGDALNVEQQSGHVRVSSRSGCR